MNNGLLSSKVANNCFDRAHSMKLLTDVV